MTDDHGLVGISMFLTYEDLLAAYRFGIFPVNDPADPVLWWSPNPRWVLDPLQVNISKSMRRILRDRPWRITCDTDFEQVMRRCAEGKARKDRQSSWITPEVIEAYMRFYEEGRGHSFEVWDREDRLIGGFYGVVTGSIFAGESMFADVSNTSKYAFITACGFFAQIGILLIDCQMHSRHLESLGAYPVSREKYLELIKLHGFTMERLTGRWTDDFEAYFRDMKDTKKEQ